MKIEAPRLDICLGEMIGEEPALGGSFFLGIHEPWLQSRPSAQMSVKRSGSILEIQTDIHAIVSFASL